MEGSSWRVRIPFRPLAWRVSSGGGRNHRRKQRREDKIEFILSSEQSR